MPGLSGAWWLTGAVFVLGVAYVALLARVRHLAAEREFHAERAQAEWHLHEWRSALDEKELAAASREVPEQMLSASARTPLPAARASDPELDNWAVARFAAAVAIGWALAPAIAVMELLAGGAAADSRRRRMLAKLFDLRAYGQRQSVRALSLGLAASAGVAAVTGSASMAAAAPSAHSAAASGQYTVQNGDTLFNIAKANNTNVWALAHANNIQNPDQITTGQVLTVSGATLDSATSATSYTVQSGDTLAKIAQSHGTSYRLLAAYNGLHSPYRIAVGQTMAVPASSSNATATSSGSNSSVWASPSANAAPAPAPSHSHASARSHSHAPAKQTTSAKSAPAVDPYTVPAKPAPASAAPAAATPAASHSQLNRNGVYTVQSGDTLAEIAKANHTTVPTLMALNGMTSPDGLAVGQVVNFYPQKAAAPAPMPAAPAAPAVAKPGHSQLNKNGVYVVQPGDTLAEIAQANHTTVPTLMGLNGMTSPDGLTVGQVINFYPRKAAPPPPPPAPAPAPAPAAPAGHSRVATNGSYTVQPGDDLTNIAAANNTTVANLESINGLGSNGQVDVGQTIRVVGAPAPSAPAPAPSSSSSSSSGPVSTSGMSSFESCVINHESSGNPNVMNSSGHYGLFQFSKSTWELYGGNPADFGHASVAEQEQVFNTAMSHPGGANNWAPYDGCSP